MLIILVGILVAATVSMLIWDIFYGDDGEEPQTLLGKQVTQADIDRTA